MNLAGYSGIARSIIWQYRASMKAVLFKKEGGYLYNHNLSVFFAYEWVNVIVVTGKCNCR